MILYQILLFTSIYPKVNTISYHNKNTAFTSRCPQIRDAQWVCQKVKSFPHISSTKVVATTSELVKKHINAQDRYLFILSPELFQKPQERKILKLIEWQGKLEEKMVKTRKKWAALKKENFRAIDTILKQFKQDKLGNCGEDAFVSAAILRLNGVKNVYTAGLKIDKCQQDHAICIFNKNGKPYSGKVERDTIIIDPWFGAADFAHNIIQKYKNLYSNFFEKLKPNSEISFYKVQKFNLSQEEVFLLSIQRPELLYPENNRCFMQKK